MRPYSLLLASSLCAVAVTAGAAILPRTAPGGAIATSTGDGPICGLIRVNDQSGLNDAEIAHVYLQANLFEVETAKLGQEKGTAPQVKAHGEMVAKDHGGVVKMFEALLLKSGVKPAADAGSAKRVSDQQKLVADLKQLTGAAFDRAYIAHELANHRAVIKALNETLLPAASNAQIAEHFKSVLPAFEHHLAMTTDAAKALGLPSEATP